MSNYQSLSFEEIFTCPLRNGLNRPKVVRGSGVKMVNMGELFNNYRIRNISMDRVPLSKKESEKYLLEEGDLLFARQSLVLSGAGKCVIFLEDKEAVTWESHIIRARLNKQIACPTFYFYYFNSTCGRQLIETIVEQVAAAGIRGTDLAKLPIPLPPLPEQKAIASILSSLDDKIELNQQMNQTLEEIARGIFKSWFVDFDPVRAKMEGKQPVGMDTATANLFPESFEESALGLIPKGWRVGTIDECTSLIIDYRGKTPKKLGGDWTDYGIPAISAKNIKAGKMVRKEAIRYVNQELFKKWMKDTLAIGDIIMTSEAPLGELFYLARNANYCLSQRLYGIRANQEICKSIYLYHALASEDVQLQLENRATGTTVVGIRQTELRKVEILLPPLEIQNIVAQTLESFMIKIHSNDEQSRTLANIRDTLLPKLMSGEIRVREAERMIEEVV